MVSVWDQEGYKLYLTGLISAMMKQRPDVGDILEKMQKRVGAIRRRTLPSEKRPIVTSTRYKCWMLPTSDILLRNFIMSHNVGVHKNTNRIKVIGLDRGSTLINWFECAKEWASIDFRVRTRKESDYKNILCQPLSWCLRRNRSKINWPVWCLQIQVVAYRGCIVYSFGQVDSTLHSSLTQ